MQANRAFFLHSHHYFFVQLYCFVHKKLCHLDLCVRSRDCYYSFIGSLDRFDNGDVGFWVGPDLSNTRVARTYKGTLLENLKFSNAFSNTSNCLSHILGYGHLHGHLTIVFLIIFARGSAHSWNWNETFFEIFKHSESLYFQLLEVFWHGTLFK